MTKLPWRGAFAAGLAFGLLCVLPTVHADAASAGTMLLEAYKGLTARNDGSASARAWKLASSETSSTVSGEVFGTLDHGYASFATALTEPANWCDILILHINNKACAIVKADSAEFIHLKVARKYDQPSEQAYPIAFAFRVVEAGPKYLAARLDAGTGPLGTRDYRILVEAIPVGDGQIFLHLSYSYGFGLATRMAMGMYFATVGRGKVGFTETGHSPNGQPVYVGGMRGLVERNTMRYFLAIQAYQGSLELPKREQFDLRLRHWFEATEVYATQLHETDLSTYVNIKRSEHTASSSPD